MNNQNNGRGCLGNIGRDLVILIVAILVIMFGAPVIGIILSIFPLVIVFVITVLLWYFAWGIPIIAILTVRWIKNRNSNNTLYLGIAVAGYIIWWVLFAILAVIYAFAAAIY